LTDECGDRGTLLVPGLWIVSRLLELCEDALLCDVWRGMLRTEETEEDVDLRPRSPVELRRYEERGVIGDGERELCLGLPRLPPVSTRATVGLLSVAATAFGFDTTGVSADPYDDLREVAVLTSTLLFLSS
jgi:hypothetical protein